MDIYKAALLGLAIMLLSLHFREVKSSYSIYLSLAASIFFIGFVVNKLKVLIDSIDYISKQIGISTTYISLLLKMIGIAYICEFTSNICSDSGNKAIASQIELIGKVSILVLNVPVLISIIDMLSGNL